ncbi:MAG: NAD(P)-binding domain-containing protein, partial [Terriglobales bacterium]
MVSAQLLTQPKTKPLGGPSAPVDVLVIGAGPTGMACAIGGQRAGLSALLIDKGCLVNSIFHYPANMVFFTT